MRREDRRGHRTKKSAPATCSTRGTCESDALIVARPVQLSNFHAGSSIGTFHPPPFFDLCQPFLVSLACLACVIHPFRSSSSAAASSSTLIRAALATDRTSSLSRYTCCLLFPCIHHALNLDQCTRVIPERGQIFPSPCLSTIAASTPLSAPVVCATASSVGYVVSLSSAGSVGATLCCFLALDHCQRLLLHELRRHAVVL